MNADRTLQAAIAETRQSIERLPLTDTQAFALSVLVAFADAKLDVGTVDRLQSVYSVRVGSDKIYPV